MLARCEGVPGDSGSRPFFKWLNWSSHEPFQLQGPRRWRGGARLFLAVAVVVAAVEAAELRVPVMISTLHLIEPWSVSKEEEA